jgi:glycosyltransferase involved in cell wall biosynthesis
VPVLAARAGSLPEVVGNREVLFDPLAPKELARLIERVLRDQEWAGRLRAENPIRARRFTWEAVAGRVIDALRRHVNAAPARDRAVLRDAAIARIHALERATMPAPDVVADLMALSEPHDVGRARLFVDMTETLRSGLNTGIQRVVRKTAAHLSGHGFELVPIRFSVAGRIERAEAEGSQSRQDTEPRTFALCPRDHLLLLDSSWGDLEAQRSVLRAARMNGASITAVLYDLVPVRAPAFCSSGMPAFFLRWLEMVLTYAQNIVCISRAVADDLCDLLAEIRFERDVRIGHWPLGADFIDRAVPTVASRPSIPTFLVVGTLEPRKGHRMVLRAFEQLWASGAQIALVFAGKLGWDMADFAQALKAHPEHGRRLSWVEAPSDARLAELYQSANAVIAASYAEGYGLPLAEAMYFGRPLIVSDIPVFREVAAKAQQVRFFATGSETALAEAIRAECAGSGVIEGRHSRRPVTWQDSGKALAALLEAPVWYRHVTPEKSNGPLSPDPFGRCCNIGPPPPDTIDLEIDLVERPLNPFGQGGKYVFRIANRSAAPLFGRPDKAGRFGLSLGCQVFDGKARALRIRQVMQPVPLVIGVGAPVYMAVELGALPSAAKYIEAGLHQNGTGWIGQRTRMAV